MKYPLTNPQRNIYITEQFFGATSVSNVGGYVLLSEKFDIGYIKGIIQQIIADNDGLRMRVAEDDDGAYQTVAVISCDDIECASLSNINELEVYVAEQVALPFDTGGNLYDFRVIDLPDNTALMIKLHHYVADSWSISNLLSQLFSHLDSAEFIAPSYIDFIKRDSEYSGSKKQQKDKEYWSAKYQDKPTYISLYLSDIEQHDIRAGRNTYSLNAETTLSIKEYCEKHEISPAVFFEAIVSLYAMRINNADDITLCTISANRTGLKEKYTVGMFNTKHIRRTNTIIGIAFERSFEMLIAMYAVLKSGCAYMPIDSHFPADRIRFMIEDSKTPIILTQSKFISLFEGIETIIVDNFDYSIEDSSNLNLPISSQNTAYVIYTSGSTGKPKGAMIAHHSVVNRIRWMHNRYPLAEGDVILQKTPYTFDVSVWELFWWSMYNGTLYILSPEGHKDPSEIVKGIFDGRVTHMHFVPSMLNPFLEYIEKMPYCIDKLKTLKYIFASGETCVILLCLGTF